MAIQLQNDHPQTKPLACTGNAWLLATASWRVSWVSLMPNLDYHRYLRLDQILSLQTPVGRDFGGSETLFIAVHQACELNLRAIIIHVRLLIEQLNNGESPAALGTVKLVNALILGMTAQTRVLNQLKTADFLEFRPLLGEASGAQSIQLKVAQALLSGASSATLNSIEQAAARAGLDVGVIPEESQSVAQALEVMRERLAIGSWATFLAESGTPSESRLAVRTLLTALLDTDMLWCEWKTAHFNLVLRHLGSEFMGTGGKDGVWLLRSLSTLSLIHI